MSSSLTYKMPAPTSKIPLPKSNIPSPSHIPVNQPTLSPQSRIPKMKGIGIKSPTSDYNSFSTPQNKENIIEEQPLASQDNSATRLRSKIPDIRTKVSIGKDIHEIDGGYKSDRSTKSSTSSISNVSRLPGSRLPTSPSKAPVSRIPTLPTSPVKNNNNRAHRKSSMESLSGDDIDWDLDKEYHLMNQQRVSDGNGHSNEGERERFSSGTCSPPSSTSSSTSPLYKRGRNPEDVPGIKMRRTSPDGESASPSKTRRPSPSKIPVAGSYAKKNYNANSTEVFSSPEKAYSDNISDTVIDVIKSSDMLHMPENRLMESDDEEEHLLVGGGEGLCPLEGGEGFVPCEPLPRENLHLDIRPSSGYTEIHKSSLPTSAPVRENLHLDTRSSLSGNFESHKTSIPSSAPVRENLHLDTRSSSSGFSESRKSSIPSSAPVRSIPEPNWSISRDESPSKQPYRKEREGFSKSSASTSQLPDRERAGSDSRSSSMSTGRLPFLPLQEGAAGSTDPDSSSSDRQSRRKNFEAFVMTGDRMINLAKTPANLDFQSKYARPVVPQTSVRTLDLNVEETSDQEEVEVCNMESKAAVDRSDIDMSVEVIHEVNTSVEVTSDINTVKSEVKSDLSTTISDVSSELSTTINDAHNELMTPLSDNNTASLQTTPTNDHQYQEEDHSPTRSNQKMASDEVTSPDISTSSLISCSEHYNGESLLDTMDPSPDSSPDTPEWSLIANGDSFHKDIQPSKTVVRREDERRESLITNRDNRVIIMINQNKDSDHNELSSPSSSSGTITPEEDARSPRSPPLNTQSSEEESDMDSLHSYHPPVKVVDIPSASRLAKRLYSMEGFKKSDISRHLSKNNEFSRTVAEEYCRLFKLSGLTLDQALRRFLSQFALIGETQDRERVLLHFSKRYLECNPSLQGPDMFQSHDAVHTLTCAIMLLNTDLHNEALQQRRMTTDEFVENLVELNDGVNFPDKLLRDIYTAIQEDPIQWVQDDSEQSQTASSNQTSAESSTKSDTQPGGECNPNPASEVSFNNQVGGINPFLSLPDPESAVDYKRGYVMRKSCFDTNNKRTKRGKRSWKMFYLTLRDLVLYCFKDEKTAQNRASFDSPQAAVRVHHSLAMVAEDYTKKQFVFRLKTCDRAEYLFQTSDQKELETWVDTINTVVARYSAPPLPAPVSSNIKFQRPLYPSSTTRLSLVDQLANHRTQVKELTTQLGEHNTERPAKGAKGVEWSWWREKVEWLESEVSRYSVYINMLESVVNKQQTNQMGASPLKVIAS